MTVLAEQRTKRVFESIPFLTNEVLAELATLVIFMLWGVNFSATKKCLEYTSPLVLSALCFGSGGLVVLVFQYKKLRMVDLKGAFIVGFFMCVSSVLQTVALNYTLVAKTSFYSCLDIPITAAFELISRRLSWGEIVGVISTLGGAFLLSWDGMAINPNYGDWVAIIATVPSAAYYVASAHYCTEEAKASICVGQLLISSVLCFLAAPFFEVPVLRPTWELGYGLLFTGCLSCGLALYVLTWAQMYTTATRAVIIGAPEPVFAAVAAYVLYDEGMFSIVNYLGAGMMLAGVLLPLVHEEARHAGEKGHGGEDAGAEGSSGVGGGDDDVEAAALLLKGAASISVDDEHRDNPMVGHYGTSIHFLHHHGAGAVPPDASSSSVGARVRHRTGAGSSSSSSLLLVPTGASSAAGGLASALSPRNIE